MDLEMLYNTSKSFRLYVDKTCKSQNVTREEAYKQLLVKHYAQYIIDDNRQYEEKEVSSEVRTNCGCC